MKRILSFLMALVMCLSLVPEAAFAQEVGESETVFQEAENDLPEQEETASEETEEEPKETEGESEETEAPDGTEEASAPTDEETEETLGKTLVITEEPEDTLLVEGTAFFYVSAAVCQEGSLTEALPSYQWQYFDGENWVELPGQRDQVLVLEGLTQENIGDVYRCWITSEELEAISQSAMITGLADEAEEAGDWETEVFINPLYEDILTEEDLPQASSVETYAEYTRYESQEEAAKAMKQAMKNRQASFFAEFYLEDSVPVGSTQFMRSIYYMAVAHTGVPTEGDYMHFEFGGYRGSYKWDDKAQIFRCTYNFLYYTTAEQEKAVDAEVVRLMEELGLAEKTSKEKIDSIYDYLCKTVTYDYKNLNNQSNTLKYTAYAALIDHTAVCQGYATAFYRLCLESGVDAREISSNSMNHAWNIVKLGAFYYCVDATWDAGHRDNYLYYLKGRNDWTSGGINGMKKHEMGDEFGDSAFSERYPVPEDNHEEMVKSFTLLEDGTLVLQEWSGINYEASTQNGCLTTNAPWREAAERIRRIEFPEGVTYIGSNAFRGLGNLEELAVPDTVTAIERSAFQDCAALKRLTLPAGIRLGQDAFSGCGIEALTVPADWYAGALNGCLKKLRELHITGSGTMAGYTRENPAPWCNTGVRTVTFAEGLQKIGAYALLGCTELQALTLPRQLRYIGDGAFSGCTGLTELVLPGNLVKIYAEAFDGCSSLETLTFTGSKLPTLEQDALKGAVLTCVYPCTWQTLPEGNYGGTVTWKGDHSLEFVPGTPVTETADGALEHWKCSLCGRLYTDESCGQELSPENVTLYREIYPIIYEGLEDGENPNPSSYPAVRGLELKDAARQGYIFEGWYKDSDFRQRIQSIAPATHENLTLYAKWKSIQYTLVFQANGGSGSAPRAALDYAQETVLPADGFRYTGHTLSGWNTAKDGSGDGFALGQTVSALTAENKKTVTLYAQWTPVTYRVRLEPNDGKTEAVELEVSYGENFVFPGEPGSMEGYHISQWTTKSNGTGTRYNVGKTVKNLSAAEQTLTFYGKWTANTYTVVFHGNGSSGKDKKQTFTYGKAAALIANGFSRTGYLFAGWSREPEGQAVYSNKEQVENLTTEQEGSVDLYAVWTPITYKVVFKANGAAGEMAAAEWTYDETYSLPEMTFDRPGFTFLGWGTSASGKALYENEQEVGNLAAVQGRTVTLYALWKAHSYEIHFIGGEDTTGTTRAMTKLSCGRTYTLNANGFKKAGYDFVGWLDADGKEYPNKDKRMNFVLEDGGVLELRAQWVPHPYTITYKNCIAYDDNPNPAKYDVETQVTFDRPIRGGVEFLGWYLDSRCTKPVDSTEGRTGNLTVYAKWGSGGRGYGYTIAFDGNGAASGKTNPMTGRWNGTVYTLNANGFKRPGYTFLGWSLDKDAEDITWANRAKVGNLAEAENQTVTLYAVWAPITYKFTYQKLITADENPNPPTFTVEDTIVLQDPVRPGCAFEGWYLESSYRNRVQQITPGFRTANLTLYAKWANSGKGYGYTIAFDGNGAASGKMNPMTGRWNGTMYTLNSNGFKRPGYTFLGWSLDKDAEDITWANRAKVGNLAEEAEQTVTLYAVWRKQ